MPPEKTEIKEVDENTKKVIREELGTLMKSDRYTFERLIQILDGRNIKLGTGTGTKIGTASTEKLGFWGNTPDTQPAAVADASADVTSLANQLNTLLARLRSVGIIDT